MISYFIDFFRGRMEPLELIVYVLSITYVCLCATPLHEFAHAFVAVKLGDDTPKIRGRLTINPMAHIDPIGILMIFLFGFGYAKPVEIRMRNFKKPKRDMAFVALAGPVSNFIQAFIYLAISAGFSFLTIITAMPMLQYICMFFTFAALVNIRLGVFNMIPVPPLDGSRLLTALLPTKIYFKIMQYERYISLGLMVLLFTGVLSKPLSILSDFVFSVFEFIILLPFKFIG